jgi:transcriptional regulator with XRE-family HTH domain
MPKTIDLSKTSIPGRESEETKRFAEALRRAMIRHRCSERKLATDLGITIGTTQKYFRGMVHPLRVATGINSKLAGLLGVTLEDLVRYYETGAMSSSVELPQVLSWVRSTAGVEHMSEILRALAEVGSACSHTKPAELQRFTWPLEELDNAKVSPALRQRMGLTDEALEGLVNEGRFDDELVEAFAVATNLDEAEVRLAFEKRLPIPPA